MAHQLTLKANGIERKMIAGMIAAMRSGQRSVVAMQKHVDWLREVQSAQNERMARVAEAAIVEYRTGRKTYAV